MVFYLLAMSWVTVFFSLPSFHRFPAGTKALKLLSVMQSYLIFAFSLVILITAEKFGNRSECNPIAVVVLFQPFSALKPGRIIGWIVIIGVATMYTIITAIEYLPPPPKQFKQWAARRRIKRDDQGPRRAQENDLRLNGSLREVAFVSRRVLQPVSHCGQLLTNG